MSDSGRLMVSQTRLNRLFENEPLGIEFVPLKQFHAFYFQAIKNRYKPFQFFFIASYFDLNTESKVYVKLSVETRCTIRHLIQYLLSR